MAYKPKGRATEPSISVSARIPDLYHLTSWILRKFK